MDAVHGCGKAMCRKHSRRVLTALGHSDRYWTTMEEPQKRDTTTTTPHGGPSCEEDVEGLDPSSESWGDYPLDDLLIRQENRTIHDVIRRIDKSAYVMDPDFQRDFIWLDDKQSKLIESVIMRIPLPVFYLAEDAEGRMIVVDGLQRLTNVPEIHKG